MRWRRGYLFDQGEVACAHICLQLFILHVAILHYKWLTQRNAESYLPTILVSREFASVASPFMVNIGGEWDEGELIRGSSTLQLFTLGVPL